MILRNSKDRERNFKMLYKIEHQDKTYIVYEDYITGKCYAGIKKDNILEKVNDEEKNLINRVLKGVSVE